MYLLTVNISNVRQHTLQYYKKNCHSNGSNSTHDQWAQVVESLLPGGAYMHLCLMVPWVHLSPFPPKQHINQFSCFCMARGRDQQTDSHTNHITYRQTPVAITCNYAMSAYDVGWKTNIFHLTQHSIQCFDAVSWVRKESAKIQSRREASTAGLYSWEWLLENWKFW